VSAEAKRTDARAILDLAREKPAAARDRAAAALTTNPTPEEAAILHFAAGLAHRALANGAESTHHLEEAVRFAGADDQLRGEVLRSLAFNYAQTGNHRLADETIEESIRLLDGQPADLSRLQQAFMLLMRGDHRTALPVLNTAVTGFTESDDDAYLELTLYNRALVHMEFGDYEASIADLVRSYEIGIRLGHETSAADAALHLSQVLGWRDDIPGAMKWHARSVELRTAVGATNPLADAEHAFVLIQARLMREAETTLRKSLPRLTAAGGNEATVAMGRLLLADLLAERGDFSAALEQTDLAAGESPPDSRWRFDIAATQHRIRVAAGEASPGMLAEMVATAAEMARNGEVHAAALERFAALQVALRCGETQIARDLAATAQTLTNRGPLWLQTQAWTALARFRFATGDRRGAGAAAQAGLRRLARYRAGIGAADLRVHAAEWGRELATIGLRLALDSRSAPRVYAWSEQQRTEDQVSPDANPALEEALADLRRAAARSRAGGESRVEEMKRLARAEQRVTVLARQTDGGTNRPVEPLGPQEIQLLLDDRALVEFVELDNALWAVAISSNSIRLHPLTGISAIRGTIGHLRLAGERIARPSTSAQSRAAAIRSANDAAGQLRAQLIDPLQLAGARLVVVPSGTLYAVPWSLVVDAPVEVAPSARTWAAACRRTQTAPGLVTVAGPGLSHATIEAGHISASGDGPVVTKADEVLEQISSAGTAHFACHARARTDNPLFSSLLLDDGELTLHDIRRLPRVPGRVILAACSGGEAVLTSGDEAISMASSFLSLGARTVVAPLYTVSDETTALLMRSLYERMGRGDDPAAALFTIRNSSNLDLAFTAAVFTCFGAA